MIITPESNAESNKELEPSATKPRKYENRFQRRRRERNHLAPLSTSQQPSAGSASGSTQQLQPRSLGTYEYSPQPLPKNTGNTVSHHRPTGAQGSSSTQFRVSSSNIRNEQARIDNGYPRRPRRPRRPASQDTQAATAARS